MAPVISVKQRIDQLDAGSFQNLCDAYLAKEGYIHLVSLGTMAGSQKTTPGTPDSYSCTIDGKYVLAEYTTQKKGLVTKIRSDLKNCFDKHYSGINIEDIAEIIYCHTSSNINAGDDKNLKQYCLEKGVQLTLIGIDRIAEDITKKYPILARDYLNLNIDTGQIQTIADFISQYDANDLAAPLDTAFQFREAELEKLQQAFSKQYLVILSGAAGTGKTRLAIEFAERYQKEHNATAYVIHSHGISIFEDLALYFEHPGNYFVIVDDANQLSQLELVAGLTNKRNSGLNVKILITVRNYAIQKVKSDILETTHFSEVVVPPLSDDQIKAIVRDYLGIINPDYLSRIATIAEGNARIALIAGKIAADANRLQSISDVTGLYAEYYGKAFRDSNLEENVQLQISAGIIAFLGSVHLDHIATVVQEFAESGIDLFSFKKCAYKLHEMELVDICRDKAIAISDQCFSNYILKHVFVDLQSISLSKMLDICFDRYRERTIQAVNTLLGVFRSQDVHEFTTHEIKKVWEKRKTEAPHLYWDWVKAFYPLNQEEALLLIKKRIEHTETVVIPVDDIDVTKGKNHQSIDDELIAILGGFAVTENIDSALDLFFEYYLKRPDLFIQFYHAIDLYYGVDLPSVKYGFIAQTKLIEHFIGFSDNWNNPYVRILFIEIAKNLLRLHYSPLKADRHGKGVIVSHFSLPSTEPAIAYRKLIWEQVMEIQAITDCRSSIHGLLQDYDRGFEECSYGVVREDAQCICQIIQSAFSCGNVVDCILTEEMNSIWNVVGFHSEVLDPFLNSRKLMLFHILVGPEFRDVTSYEALVTEKTRIITEYLSQEKNHLDSILELFAVYRECAENKHSRVYEAGTGMMQVIKHFTHEKDVFISIAKVIIESGLLYGIDVHTITSFLFTFLTPKEVKDILLKAPEYTIDICLFSYFYEIPQEAIDKSIVEELYYFLKCDYDSKLQASNYRSLDFLQKYECIDSDVFLNAVKLIFAKKKYSSFVVNIYFSLLLNRYNCSPKELTLKFSEDHRLLEEIYLFESVHDSLSDCDGSFLCELCSCRKEFAKEYIRSLSDENRHLHEDKTKLQALFGCTEFIDIIDLMVNECVGSTFSILYCQPVLEAFIIVPEIIIPKSDTWIKHYIATYNSEHEKMVNLFSVLAELPDNRKAEFIRYLIRLNADPDLFKRIPLHPMSYSWSGSAVPLYSKWIDFLRTLLPLFTGIQYLTHKMVVQEEIENLSQMIESAEIEELLRG